MKIEISADDIEKLVREELVKAGLGKFIAEGVQKALSSYDSPVEKALRQYMSEVATRLIREHFTAHIEEAIMTHIKAKVTTEAIDKIVDTAVTKMVRAAEDRGY
jgi:hypothetical protein